MFVHLRYPPRLPVEAELLPTLFGDVQIRINETDYAVEKIAPGEPAIAEALKLTHGESGYLLIVTRTGEASCDCPNFEFEGRRDRRLCKHLFAAWATGLLTRNHRPEFLKSSSEKSHVGADAS